MRVDDDGELANNSDYLARATCLVEVSLCTRTLRLRVPAVLNLVCNAPLTRACHCF